MKSIPFKLNRRRYLLVQISFLIFFTIGWIRIFDQYDTDLLSWPSVAWLIIVFVGYGVLTHCVLQALYKKITASVHSRVTKISLMLASVCLTGGILFIFDFIWALGFHQSIPSSMNQAFQRAMVHVFILSVWLLCFHIAHWNYRLKQNGILKEESKYYGIFQLTLWSFVGIQWLLLVKGNPTIIGDTLVLFSWILLICSASLLISHWVMRPYCQVMVSHIDQSKVWPAKILFIVFLCSILLLCFEAIWFVFTQNTSAARGDSKAFGSFLIKSLFLLLWSVGYTLWINGRLREKALRERLNMDVALHEAQLLALKQQLNPHFLFNTLNSIRAMVIKNQDLARDMISNVANILRYSLYMSDHDKVSLSQEMNIVEEYLALEKIRFKERLTVSMNIPESTTGLSVLPLSIQTLVENAIKHNIDSEVNGLNIHIDAQYSDSGLLITVTNNGRLKQLKVLSQLNDREEAGGIGIDNTIMRLQMVFGKNASLELVETELHEKTLSEKKYSVIARLFFPQKFI